MTRIAIVEDDDNVRELVCYALSSAGFNAQGFEDGVSFFRNMTEPDLLILDIMLPGQDGYSILKQIKSSARLKDLPVIMLTAKSTELDRVRGLDWGADDYITKPFSVLELISRVKAVLRRCGAGDQDDVLHIGSIIIDSSKRIVTVNGTEIVLTYKEFELLAYLAVNEGIVLSRDKIMDAVWGFDFEGESRTVDMHIKTLRQKLGISGDIIKTVRNVGYMLRDTQGESLC